MQTRFKQLKQFWRRYDRRYGWKWRALNAAAACLVVVGVIAPLASQMLEAAYYNLSSDTRALIGKTDPTLLKQLHYTAADSTYHFNQGAVAEATAASLNSLKKRVGTASGHGSDTSLYGLDVPTDFAKGVTYHDTNTQLSFTLAPQFGAGSGKQVDGHLVFPLSLSTRAIYTLKNNGLKEDIVVNKVTNDTMSFSYTLHLPKTLEAHKLDNGSIGIYSADPSLYGNMKYATAADRAAIQKAREAGEKTHLVFGLPAPIIKDAHGQSVGEAHFDLNGSNLRVVATGLDGIKGAFTIDPSVVVTSTSDFQTGNNDGMINFGTSGQVTRDGLTAGSVGTWTATTSLPAALEQGGSVAYNGYLYQVGGASLRTMYSAPINSDGSIGAWTTLGNAPGAGGDRNVMVYNGYIYDVGDSSTSQNVYYATIGNGSIGTWTTGAATPAINNAAGTAIYQNYLYLVGGGANGGGGSYYTTVYYAVLNADGSVGNWTATTSLPTATGMNTAIAYNGYLYSIGGAYSGGFTQNIYYAPINADGSVGAWTTTASIPSSKYGQYSYIYDGYIYYIGGWTNTVTYYAPIYANGALGTWQTSTNIISTSGLRYLSGATYNGNIYLLGGREESTSADVATVQYAKINPVATPAVPTVVGTSTSSEVLPTVTSGYKAGDLILHQVYLEPQNESSSTATYNTPTPTTGYTWLPNTPVNSNDANMTTDITQRDYVEYKWATGTETAGTSTSITGTGGDWYGDAGTIVIRGADPSGLPYAEEATGGGKGASTYPPLSITAGGTNNLLVYLGTSWDSGDYASLSGWTAVKVTHAGVGTMLYNTQAAAGSTGTVAPARTTNSDNRRTGVLLSFRAPPVTASGDGTLGSWQTATNSFSNGRSGLATATYNGYVYVVNGYNSGGYLNDVQYAKLNNDGTVGSWQPTTATPGAGYTKSAAVAYGGYLYVLGGTNASGSTNSVYYAKINSDGSLASWQTATNMPGSQSAVSVAAYNGYLYILGGAGSSLTYYTKINSDGSLPASWTSTTSMNTVRGNFHAIVYGGYMFAIGGQGSSGVLNTVESAPINSDGTLGSWSYTTSFATARQMASVVAYNGYLYIMGGQDGSSNPLSDTQYAMIKSNGSIGSWQTTTSLPVARYTADAVVSNGNVYLMGGNAPPNYYTTDVLYVPINTIARVGHYSRLVDLGSVQTVTGITYNGTLPLASGMTPVTYRAAGANGIFGAVTPLSGIGTGITARYLLVNFTLDDNRTGIFPDSSSTAATVADFTVNYAAAAAHPSPAQRLRQGQTLQGGVLSPFDIVSP